MITQLRRDRIFDDSLMQQGIIPHYAPLRRIGDTRQERGIDVWLALEALELTIHKRFHAIVLVASDGDYVPLLRKLNTLGVHLTLLAWEFSYTFGQDEEERKKETKVSQRLIDETAYTVMMHEKIDSKANRNDPVIDKLFYEPLKYEENPLPDTSYASQSQTSDTNEDEDERQQQEGQILSLHNGYGFVEYPPNNLFFYHDDVENVGFDELKTGDKVSYIQSTNEEGKGIALHVQKIFD